MPRFVHRNRFERSYFDELDGISDVLLCLCSGARSRVDSCGDHQGYGPHMSTNKFGATKGVADHFPVAMTRSEALERESHFEGALARALKPLG